MIRERIIRKRLGWLALVVIVLVGGFLLLKRPSGGELFENGKLKVTASFYPMAEFARQVGGDLADVTVLVKPGVEPHDYDPTPQDMVGVHRSKVLIFNGAGLEPWATKVRGELEKAGSVVVEASQGIKLLAPPLGEEDLAADPHLWLDPVLAKQEVEAVKQGFIKADPAHRATYEANALAYGHRLDALDAAYRIGLGQCGRRDIMTSHQAFGYLAKRYGLEVFGIAGLSPDEEPSPQKLKVAAQFAREHNLKYIFLETLASPKLSQTLAEEVGAQTLVFNPLEGLSQAEVDRGKNYVAVQRDNLENLRIALDCK